jgi:hypothetical protein
MVGFGELEKIVEEVIVPYFKVLIQDNRLVGRDLSRYLPCRRKGSRPVSG